MENAEWDVGCGSWVVNVERPSHRNWVSRGRKENAKDRNQNDQLEQKRLNLEEMCHGST